MATTRIMDSGDADASPARDREEIATIIAIVEAGEPTQRDRVARVSPTADGIIVLEIVFGQEDQRAAWSAFDRLLASGNQNVQVRGDEHGWTVRVEVTLRNSSSSVGDTDTIRSIP